MNKHTPGPWSIGEPEGVGTGLFVPVHAPSHGELATVVWCMEDDNLDDAPSPTCQANANLITAAPDLLEALEKCAELRGTLELHGLVELVNAALAKARGGS